MDLIHFVQKNFGPLNLVMKRAGMTEMDIYNLTRDIFPYFNLPFDSHGCPSSQGTGSCLIKNLAAIGPCLARGRF